MSNESTRYSNSTGHRAHRYGDIPHKSGAGPYNSGVDSNYSYDGYLWPRVIGFFRTLRERAETPEAIRLHQSAVYVGVALVVLGIISTCLVAISHLSTVQKLKRGEIPPPPLWPLSVTISVLLSLMALFELWNLFHH